MTAFQALLKKISGCKEDELQLQIDSLNKNIQALSKQVTDLQTVNNIKEPALLSTITFGEAYQIFSKLTGNIFLSDDKFNTTSVDEAKIFTLQTKTFARTWVKEDHDCDNFSFALMGYWSEGLKSYAFGIAWSQAHAFNIMIDDKKQIWIVEPQTNQYMTLDQAKAKSSPDGLSYLPIRMVII